MKLEVLRLVVCWKEKIVLLKILIKILKKKKFKGDFYLLIFKNFFDNNDINFDKITGYFILNA